MSLKGSPARGGNRCKTNEGLEVEVPGRTGGVGTLRSTGPIAGGGGQKGFPEEGSWGGGWDSQIGEGVGGLRKTFHTEGGVILGVGNGMAASTELVISSLLVQGLLPLNVVGGGQ